MVKHGLPTSSWGGNYISQKKKPTKVQGTVVGFPKIRA